MVGICLLSTNEFFEGKTNVDQGQFVPVYCLCRDLGWRTSLPLSFVVSNSWN